MSSAYLTPPSQGQAMLRVAVEAEINFRLAFAALAASTRVAFFASRQPDKLLIYLMGLLAGAYLLFVLPALAPNAGAFGMGMVSVAHGATSGVAKPTRSYGDLLLTFVGQHYVVTLVAACLLLCLIGILFVRDAAVVAVLERIALALAGALIVEAAAAGR